MKKFTQKCDTVCSKTRSSIKWFSTLDLKQCNLLFCILHFCQRSKMNTSIFSHPDLVESCNSVWYCCHLCSWLNFVLVWLLFTLSGAKLNCCVTLLNDCLFATDSFSNLRGTAMKLCKFLSVLPSGTVNGNKNNIFHSCYSVRFKVCCHFASSSKINMGCLKSAHKKKKKKICFQPQISDLQAISQGIPHNSACQTYHNCYWQYT